MKRRADLTFKHNLSRGRHGWLRLTPAYSLKVVVGILDRSGGAVSVLDPFSGSGTTGLTVAERGGHCDLLDVNPFLVWFARAKTASYTADQLSSAREGLRAVVTEAKRLDEELWTPPIKNIERWWEPTSLDALARLHRAIDHLDHEDQAVSDLLLVVFCRCVIEWSNAAFNHQSMSFKDPAEPSLFDVDKLSALYAFFLAWGDRVLASASAPPPGGVCVRLGDARDIPPPTGAPYDLVVTSPPYVNRMSYIRELRPYMYWLGYLVEAREAGELDWSAIGGTWGIATSRVAQWEPNGIRVPHPGLAPTIDAIASTPDKANADLLARYVHRYFADMTEHVRSVYPHVKPGGAVHYIVGNSKFYDTMVHAEEVYASILQDAGFEDVRVETIRKRNSKKELFEFDVSGVKPSA